MRNGEHAVSRGVSHGRSTYERERSYSKLRGAPQTIQINQVVKSRSQKLVQLSTRTGLSNTEKLIARTVLRQIEGSI